MSLEPPSIFGSVKTAFEDAIAAVRAMPGPFLLTMLANLLIRLWGDWSYPASPAEFGAGSFLVSFVDVLVGSAVSAPLAVMVHRRIILSEDGAWPALDRLTPAILEFFVVSVFLNLAVFGPMALSGAIVLLGIDKAYIAVSLLILFGGLLAVIFFGVRLILLFPAVAVHDPDRSVGTAFAKTAGLFWRLFAIVSIITIAATALNFGMEWLAKAAGLKFAATIAVAAVGAGTLVALVAVASRFYLWRGSVINAAPAAV